MAVDSPNNKRKAEEQQPEPVDAKRAKEADVETANSPASPSEPVAAAVNTTTVIESAEQFHKIVAEDKFTVAAFFAPWCGGCKTAAPHVAKLAQELTDVAFVKTDAGEMEEFCEEVDVDSFPSFRIYKAGKILGDYVGSKNEKIEEFIRKHVTVAELAKDDAAKEEKKPTMIKIESSEQFHKIVAEDKFTVASFSAPWCGGCKTVAPHVAKLAEELKDVTFIKTDAGEMEEFCEEVEVDSYPSFRVYKAGKILGDYCGSKAEKVEEFIRKHLN